MIAEDINSIESESGVIATLFHHSDYLFYSEDLLPNHFTSKTNKIIYAAITKLVRSGVFTIDSYNLMEIISNDEALKRTGNNITLEQLNELEDMSEVLCRHTVEEYKLLISNVLDAAFRRDIYAALKDCEYICQSDSHEDVQKEIYMKIDDVMTSYRIGEDVPVYSEIVDQMWEEIKSRQGTGYAGIPFKFPSLNDYVTIERGELIIFGAQQKMGKSMMLLNCAVDLLEQDYSVLYIDSELSSRLFTARLLSNLSGVKYRDLTSGNYSPEDEEKIIKAKDWMKTRKFTHIYTPIFTNDAIYTTVKKINNIQPLDVVIIDYFKSSGDETDAFATYAQMGRCVDCVKNEIAGAMNIAAIGAAQATVNNRLADSAKIARNASTIVMLMDKTPDEIEQDGGIDEGGNRKAVVMFNRNGAQHAQGEWINLQFDGDHVKYEEAKRQHIPVTPY